MDFAHADLEQTFGKRRRWALGLLIFAWGFQAIVTQSLLVREALVLMFGSEFAWGVVLSAWLLGVSVGALIGGWLARSDRVDLPERAAGFTPAVFKLVTVLLLLSAATGVELWGFRGARTWLGVAAGELLPLTQTAWAAVLLVSPVGLLVGMAFPLACAVADERAAGRVARSSPPERAGNNPPRRAGPCDSSPGTEHDPGTVRKDGSGTVPHSGIGLLGNVYALESVGSLVGGTAFSFWAVEHLAPIQTALLCGALTAAGCAGLLLAAEPDGEGEAPAGSLGSARQEPRPPAARLRVGAASLGAVAVAAAVTAVLGGNTLNRCLVERRWRDRAPGYELCAEVESKYQNLAVGRRAEQYTLYCDGQAAADFPDPYSFVPLAHFWMCQHPAPRRVLVLGGGAEGLLAEVLRHPVEHVDYVEPDPRQIDIIRPYLANADLRALEDERVTVHHVDARYFIKSQRDRFDLVMARLPEPMSALRARFYTVEFFGELRRAMTARSSVCLTVAAAPGELSSASGEYLAAVRMTLMRHFEHGIVGWGDPAHVLAATAEGLVTADPATLVARYTQRGVESPLFHPVWFEGATDWFEPDKVRHRAEELAAFECPEVSTDLRPVVYIQRLILWERMTGGATGHVVERLRSVRWSRLTLALAVLGLTTLAVCRLRRGAATGWATGAIVLSVGTTGFATMALSIIWLFAFQNLYGYVYSRIGWIIAVFMGGLVIGCGLASRLSRRWVRGTDHASPLWFRLIFVDALLALLAGAVPFILPALGAMQDTRLALVLVEWAVSLMVALTGVLGGAAFALAGGLQLSVTGAPAAAAGTINAADHAGACLGALLTGMVLVPVFGTAATAFLLVGLKLVAATLLLVAARLSRKGP